jgi:hypothetical protein
METQRFYVVMATDGDVEEAEIGGALDALGYHGLLVLDRSKTDHEHPCPSSWCIEQLRSQGHSIPAGTDCCVCWGAGLP